MSHIERRDFVKTVGAGALTLPVATALGKAKQEPIKIGQIGVGHAHASKLGVYRKSPDYEVVGIVEPDAGLRKRAENQAAYKGLKWMTQEQLLSTAGLQAVLVETRVRDLLKTAEACVTAGKHIHLDKPAGESLPHFKKVLDIAAQKKLLVQMGYMYRYNPAIVLLRDCLKKGWLGEPFEVHAVMSKAISPASRRRLAEYPGGSMFELGCHLIDLVVGILGKPKKVDAYPLHSSRLKDDLLDNMLAVYTCDRATATVKSSLLEIEGFARRHLVVCGTEGTFHIQPLDNPSAKVAFSQKRGKYQKGYQDIRFSKYSRYVDDAAEMAKIIRGEQDSRFPYLHDLAVQETVLRSCKLSLKS